MKAEELSKQYQEYTRDAKMKSNKPYEKWLEDKIITDRGNAWLDWFVGFVLGLIITSLSAMWFPQWFQF